MEEMGWRSSGMTGKRRLFGEQRTVAETSGAPTLRRLIGLRMRLPRLFRRKNRSLVEQDAETLIASFGARAYELARTRSRNARLRPNADPDRPRGHRDKVRAEIALRTGRGRGIDTATRYIERE